jgi:hypothetical protein
MKGGTLFYRVIPADRDRGYVLLTAWSKPVVRASCYTNSSLTYPTRASLNALLASIKVTSCAETLIDTTEPGIVKKLAKLFGEVPEATSGETV